MLPKIVNNVPPPVPPQTGEILVIVGVSDNKYVNESVIFIPFSLTTNGQTVSELELFLLLGGTY